MTQTTKNRAGDAPSGGTGGSQPAPPSLQSQFGALNVAPRPASPSVAGMPTATLQTGSAVHDAPGPSVAQRVTPILVALGCVLLGGVLAYRFWPAPGSATVGAGHSAAAVSHPAAGSSGGGNAGPSALSQVGSAGAPVGTDPGAVGQLNSIVPAAANAAAAPVPHVRHSEPEGGSVAARVVAMPIHHTAPPRPVPPPVRHVVVHAAAPAAHPAAIQAPPHIVSHKQTGDPIDDVLGG